MDYNNAIKIMDDYTNLLPLLELKKQNKYEQAILMIIEKTKCDEITAKAVYSDLTHNLMENKIEQQNNYQISNQVECPYCHSTDTSKITTSTKLINTVAFGLLGTKRLRNYHCNSCKSDF